MLTPLAAAYPPTAPSAADLGPRRIVTAEVPGPESRRLLAEAAAQEGPAVARQPSIAWRRARGVHVEDVDGNVFLDFTSSVLVASVGHAHPRVVAAIQAQAEEALHAYNFVHPWRVELGRRLLALGAPHGLDRVFLGSTGAEVVELAVKLARWASGRAGTLVLAGGYHGKTLAASALGGRDAGPGEVLPGIVRLPFAMAGGDPAPTLAALAALERDGRAAGIGTVLVEAVQGNAGQRDAAAGVLDAIAAFARRHDAVLVVDETQSAFGRTGAMFAFEAVGLAPDLVIAGKGISSSLPLTVLLGRSAVFDAAPARALSSTHGANPVACRAACAVLDVLEEEGLPAHAAATGAFLMDALRTAAAAAGLPVDVRGTGLMIGVQVLDGPERAAAVVRAALARGLLLLAPIGLERDVIRVAPPLVLTRAQAQEGVDVLAAAFAEVA